MYHKPIRLLYETLVDSAGEVPGKTAIMTEAGRLTYRELLDASTRLASALVGRGVQKGDRVAIYAENSQCCAISIYGILLAGAVFLVINPQTKAEKLSYILGDSDAVVLITDRPLCLDRLSCTGRLSSLREIIFSECPLPEEAGTGIGSSTFESALRSAGPLKNPVDRIPNDLAALIYTSGSTGNPKGVMMTHQAMVFAAGSIIQYLRLDSDARILNFLPLAFDYGLYQLLMSIHLGATLVLERSFTFPASILQCIDREQVTVFPGVPTVYSLLVGMYRRSPFSLPSILRVTNTAASLPADFTDDLKAIFPNALIYRMYGLTECKRVCYLEPELFDVKRESVGKAIPGTEVFLRTPDGHDVGPGVPGILHVRGPHVMKGYWKLPGLSNEMLKPGSLPDERILCTGDWFRMDGDGDLYFLGRSDEIIKTRGEKVSPVEVENTLYSFKGVKEASVIGIPDSILGQAIKAFVVLDEGISANVPDLIRHCKSRLENFMVPKYIELRSELPKTATGKIKKDGLS